MKAKFTVLIALATIGITFSSCKRYYDCECTNSFGEVSQHVVNATNPVKANKACRALDLKGNCELK